MYLERLLAENVRHLAEDVARFGFLRSLPGTYVFEQRYLPVLGGPAPDHHRCLTTVPTRC